MLHVPLPLQIRKDYNRSEQKGPLFCASIPLGPESEKDGNRNGCQIITQGEEKKGWEHHRRCQIIIQLLFQFGTLAGLNRCKGIRVRTVKHRSSTPVSLGNGKAGVQ